MTKAERILREKITEVRAWDNEPFKGLDNILNHAIIPYKDALKAVEEALAEKPNYDFSDWDFSNCLGDRIDFSNYSNDKVWDFSDWNFSNCSSDKVFANCKHYSKEDATIKAKPKPIRLIDEDIDREQCNVLRFKVKGGGKLDDWWTHELVCSYENIFIHYRLDERSTSNIQLKPYLLSKEEAYAIINEWKNELG
jgi:hypothetical protein